MIRLAVIGVTGRMGRAIVRSAGESSDARVIAGVASASSPELGKDVSELAGVPSGGGFSSGASPRASTGISSAAVKVTSDLHAALMLCDVAIDFSNASATAENVAACRAARKPLVIGTTGFSEDAAKAVTAAASDIPVLVAPNTSLGITLLIEMARAAAKSLPVSFDIEIWEAHHRHKRDAPSGTALALGRAAAEGRGQDLAKVGVGSRSGDSPRKEGEIGFAVTRGGDIVGEHSVIFAGAGEVLTLGHRATDRSIFAQGAVRAAVWLAAMRPGRYAMRDVIGYKTEA
jgi:4-hydroxy-tetrahydrodipicolinate reductase